MILPLAAIAVSITINGAPVLSYRQPYLDRGRVMAPLDPYLGTIAQSVERTEQGIVVARRGDRFAQAGIRRDYVAIGPMLRSLGITVHFDPSARVLAVRLPQMPMATATPFNAAVPRVAPIAIFTPIPQTTPRPVVSGNPTPRRTPLPLLFTPSPTAATRVRQP